MKNGYQTKLEFIFGVLIVKRLAISITILLVVSLVFANTFAAARDEQSDRSEKSRPSKNSPKQIQKTTPDANSPAEPNAVKTAIEEIPEELAEAMQHIERQGRTETREWMRGEAGNRINLAKTVQEQATTELNLLRQFAVEEGAVKTTKAIDLLLANRQQRLERILERMEEQRKRDREQDRPTRTRERTRDEDQRRPDRERRRREREDRRPRDRQQERNPRTSE